MAERRLPWANRVPRPKSSAWSGSVVWESLPEVPLFETAELSPGELLDDLEQGRFYHLNQSKVIGRGPADWQLGPRDRDRLWTVTLHYHRWAFDLAGIIAANGSDAARAEALLVNWLDDWMQRCPVDDPAARHLAWNAYAIATRIGWWVRTLMLLGRPFIDRHPEFAPRMLASLRQQARFLEDHIEWDLRANHLMRDFVGLAWAGRFFPGHHARNLLTTAGEGALAQADEQILPDGGHFERSPLYHLQIMDDLVVVRSLVDDLEARESLDAAWCRMAEFARWMRHPDGGLPQFNDAAAFGHGTPQRMFEIGKQLGLGDYAATPRGGRHFDETGFVAWHGPKWTVFFDVGPVGPDYQPGHAHADTLAIEASVNGTRLFVDPGTFAYDHDERREYDRSTAAHNTVCIDGENSSEVWHIFRVGHRALPLDVDVQFAPGAMRARGAHDGYDRLPGRPRHSRTVCVEDDGDLTLTDRIDGSGEHLVEGGFLLAPDWDARSVPGGWELTDGSQQLRLVLSADAELEHAMDVRPWHPEYGREVTTTRLTWRHQGAIPLQVECRITDVV